MQIVGLVCILLGIIVIGFIIKKMISGYTSQYIFSYNKEGNLIEIKNYLKGARKNKEDDVLVSGDKPITFRKQGKSNYYCYVPTDSKKTFSLYYIDFDIPLDIKDSIKLKYHTDFFNTNRCIAFDYISQYYNFRLFQYDNKIQLDLVYKYPNLYKPAPDRIIETKYCNQPLSSWANVANTDKGSTYVAYIRNIDHSELYSFRLIDQNLNISLELK